jgi:enhancing lycopene biosynthesis protein 2
MVQKKVGVLFSACGVLDGTEIHEAVLSLLYLDKKGAQSICFAPNILMSEVKNHIDQENMNENRNVMIESSRISRGEIYDIKDIRTSDLDALIIPGGFGVVKNLSEFAGKGPQGDVQPDVHRIIMEMYEAKKTIGALCIAPVLVGMVLKNRNITMTIGKEEGVIAALEKIGVRHSICAVDDIVVDDTHRIVTTPAYMLGPSIKDVSKGIEKLVQKVLDLA